RRRGCVPAARVAVKEWATSGEPAFEELTLGVGAPAIVLWFAARLGPGGVRLYYMRAMRGAHPDMPTRRRPRVLRTILTVILLRGLAVAVPQGLVPPSWHPLPPLDPRR